MKKINFINQLPPSISREETYELIYEIINGSKESREKLITANQRLIAYIIIRSFSNCRIDADDLFQVGNIGLIKAIDTYDIEKNYEFSSYAAKCILNEIYILIRSNAKYDRVDSFEKVVMSGSNGKDICLGDLLESDLNLEEEYLELELNEKVLEIIEQLKEQDKELIKLYYGFYGKRYDQNELGVIYNRTQAQMSRRINAVVEQIRFKLKKQQLLAKTPIKKDKRIKLTKTK